MGSDSSGSPALQVKGLIDTGAMLALLDLDDAWHPVCEEAFNSVRLPLGTTVAVLAELFHLLDRERRDTATAWQLVRSTAIRVLPIDDADMRDLERLMKRYADRLMDFADATLVHVAERESLTTILTIDHDDFETYRIGARKRFRIVPDRLP